MKTKFIEELMEEAKMIAELRGIEQNIIQKTKGMREKKIKPLATVLEEKQNATQDDLKVLIIEELESILTKMGYDGEEEYLRDSIINTVTYTLISQMERHVLEVRSKDLTPKQIGEISKIIK